MAALMTSTVYMYVASLTNPARGGPVKLAARPAIYVQKHRLYRTSSGSARYSYSYSSNRRALDMGLSFSRLVGLLWSKKEIRILILGLVGGSAPR